MHATDPPRSPKSGGRVRASRALALQASLPALLAGCTSLAPR